MGRVFRPLFCATETRPEAIETLLEATETRLDARETPRESRNPFWDTRDKADSTDNGLCPGRGTADRRDAWGSPTPNESADHLFDRS